MTRRRGFLAGGAALSVFGVAAAQTPSSLVGDWTGVLSIGSTRLRLRLTFGADGAVTLFSLDQGGAPIVGEALQVSGERVSVRFPAIRARYEATFSGDTLRGTFTQGAPAPLVLLRGEAGLTQPSPAVAALDEAGLAALRLQSGAPAMAAAAKGPDGRRLTLVTGMREVRQATAATLDDLWHLGSITKSMTATLTAKLVEQGLLSWDAPLSELLGDMAMADAYREVTLRHLLSHRSGLPSNLPMARIIRYPRQEADARASRRAFAAEALAMTPVGRPVEAFEYSNNGYVVAGAILEQASGRPWEELIQAALFAPVGMASAGFGAPGAVGALDQPVGHGAGFLGLRPFPPGAPVNDNPAVLGPAGRVHMRLEDLLRFANAHRDRNAFLSAESWAVLHTPPFGGDYAMGLVVRPDGSLWHNGSNTIWYAEVLIDRSSGVVAAAAANSGVLQTVQPAVGQALAGAAAAVVG